jgi:hypothetical protein
LRLDHAANEHAFADVIGELEIGTGHCFLMSWAAVLLNYLSNLRKNDRICPNRPNLQHQAQRL